MAELTRISQVGEKKLKLRRESAAANLLAQRNEQSKKEESSEGANQAGADVGSKDS